MVIQYLLITKKQHKFGINNFSDKIQQKMSLIRTFQYKSGTFPDKPLFVLYQNLYPNVNEIRVVFVFNEEGVESI